MHAQNTLSSAVPASTGGRLLNEKEAAEYFGVSPRTLQDLRLKGGGCPYVKIGRAVRYRMDDLSAFVEAGRRAHTSEGAR